MNRIFLYESKIINSTTNSSINRNVLYSWHPTGALLAYVGTYNNINNTNTPSSTTINTNNTNNNPRIINIISRSSILVDSVILPLNANILNIEWDRLGEVLSILQDNSTDLYLYYIKLKKLECIELNLKDVTYIQWSKTKNIISIGTSKGDVLLYNRVTYERINVSSKHKKKITYGNWSNDGKLCFCSDDRQISICNEDGVTIGQVRVKTKPSKVVFGSIFTLRESVVSVSLDRKTILLYNLDEPENALELAFQQRYGSIVTFQWFKTGYILVAFSLGYVVVISTFANEIGREQFCAKYHRDILKDQCYSAVRSVLATCGDNNVLKIVDMSTWKEVHSEVVDKEYGQLESISWSPDGGILTVTTRTGVLLMYSLKNDLLKIKGIIMKKKEDSIGEIRIIFLFVIVLFLMAFAFCHSFNIPFSSLIYSLLGSKPIY